MQKSKTNSTQCKRGRKIQVPRGVGGYLVSRVKRSHNAGDVARIASDTGHRFPLDPGTLLDWTSLIAVFGQFRVMSVQANFVMRGELDATPSYPTFIVYHDLVRTAATPSIITEAFQKNHRILSFGPTKPTGKFRFIPMVFPNTSVTVGINNAAVPSPQFWCTSQPSALLPLFSDIAFWGSSYNTTLASPIISLVWEIWLEFRYPV